MRCKAIMSDDALAFDCAHCLADDGLQGVVTDEHAMSSYGLPVFVADDGQVYGAGEALGAICLYPEDNAEAEGEAAQLSQAALSAGYKCDYSRETPPIKNTIGGFSD